MVYRMFKNLIFKIKMKAVDWHSGQFYKRFQKEGKLSKELRKNLIFQRIKQLLTTAYEQTDIYHGLYQRAGNRNDPFPRSFTYCR